MGSKSEISLPISNFRPNGNLGQHFIVDRKGISDFCKEIPPNSNVMEIGPGFGNLTTEILKKASKVVGIEIDRRFEPYLKQIQRKHDNLKIIYGDAISTDLGKIIRSSKGKWQIVSNLPFHISEPFIQKVIALPVENIILIVGQQLGYKMAEVNTTQEFTRLALLSRTFFSTKIVAKLNKVCFYPKPRTDSLILKLTPKSEVELKRDLYVATFSKLFITQKDNPTIMKVLNITLKEFGLSKDIVNILGLPNTTLSKPFFRLSNQEIAGLVIALRKLNSIHPLDEYLDLVNRNDKVIGKMKRSEVYSKDLSNFRTVNAFLINSKGQIWVPRRAKDKRIFPLCLDMSMGGHVESGETYDQAFKRELKEELNIDVAKISYKVLGKANPHENDISCFSTIYEIRSDKAPEYNKNDFVEYYWLTPKEVLEKIVNGDKAKSDLPKLIKTFYL